LSEYIGVRCTRHFPLAVCHCLKCSVFFMDGGSGRSSVWPQATVPLQQRIDGSPDKDACSVAVLALSSYSVRRAHIVQPVSVFQSLQSQGLALTSGMMRDDWHMLCCLYCKAYLLSSCQLILNEFSE
jgi:hypothetical protein